MRTMLLVFCLLVAFAAPGEARGRHHHHHHHYASWGGCAWPAAHGGACGCVAMGIVGLRDRRYWAVSSWRGFPRTSPHPGAAAIWRNGSHVEIVSAVNRDGTVDTRGSVGWRHVPQSRLVFVEPSGDNHGHRARNNARVQDWPFAFRVEARPAGHVAQASHRYRAQSVAALAPPLPPPRPPSQTVMPD